MSGLGLGCEVWTYPGSCEVFGGVCSVAIGVPFPHAEANTERVMSRIILGILRLLYREEVNKVITPIDSQIPLDTSRKLRWA